MNFESDSTMTSGKKIAIVGAGPMGTYTLKELLKSECPLDITIFEASGTPGCGMPYRAGMNADYMYCNAFSKEIPPITQRLVTWLHAQDDAFLADWDLARSDIDAREFYPRVLLGEYMQSEFAGLCDKGRAGGHRVTVLLDHKITDILPYDDCINLLAHTQGDTIEHCFDHIVLATGHDWPRAPRIGSADLVSPWPYTNITDQPPRNIGILGASLSAIDVIVALGHAHGTFLEDANNVTWFPNEGSEEVAITMVSHNGIMPEPDFHYPYPYAPLTHINAKAVAAEVAQGSDNLLSRVFALLLRELRDAAPDYMADLGPETQTIEGFAPAYFAYRKNLGGLRALRSTLDAAMTSMTDKQTQVHRYALLRGHENFELILDHLDDADWALFCDHLMPVFGDCYAAIPHISVRRVLALYDAGVLDLIPTGPESTFENSPSGGVTVGTIDGDITFDTLIDARGQSAAPMTDLPFPTLCKALVDPAVAHRLPFRLPLATPSTGSIYCLSMPQVLLRHPFSQGLPNCEDLSRVVAQDILAQHETTLA